MRHGQKEPMLRKQVAAVPFGRLVKRLAGAGVFTSPVLSDPQRMANVRGIGRRRNGFLNQRDDLGGFISLWPTGTDQPPSQVVLCLGIRRTGFDGVAEEALR